MVTEFDSGRFINGDGDERDEPTLNGDNGGGGGGGGGFDPH